MILHATSCNFWQNIYDASRSVYINEPLSLITISHRFSRKLNFLESLLKWYFKCWPVTPLKILKQCRLNFIFFCKFFFSYFPVHQSRISTFIYKFMICASYIKCYVYGVGKKLYFLTNSHCQRLIVLINHISSFL